MGKQCANCYWGVAIYKREYKGVVLGCQNPDKKDFQGLDCFVPKDEGDKNANDTGKDKTEA